MPSRFYNLLAVGRPVIVAAEPDSEAALLAQEEDVGWVVSPEDAAQLALTIRQAALDRAGTMQKGQRAAKLAEKYGEGAALTSTLSRDRSSDGAVAWFGCRPRGHEYKPVVCLGPNDSVEPLQAFEA